MNRKVLRRDAALFLGLIVLHELFRHSLAGEAIVSALFSPGGGHTTRTLLVGVSFVALRVVLFVGVPGWIGAQLIMAACAWVTYTRSRTRSSPMNLP